LPLILTASLLSRPGVGAAQGGGGGGGENTPEEAVYTLEILYPKAIAAAPNGLDANNRCYFAYPGITYTIRAAAIGGSYPYTWSLSNAPGGMSIDASTGVITWTNPTTTASNIQVTCTDALDNTDSETYSITVGTSGWLFLDAVSGSDAAAGTLAAPWQTLDKLYDSSGAYERTYFRAGTYTPAGITVENADDVNGEERIIWAGVSRSTIWLAYPGDAQPIIDFGYSGTGYPYNTGDSVPRFRFGGAASCLIGLKFTNSMTMAFQMARGSNRGVYVWDCDFDNTGPGINGGNSAFIMWQAEYGSGGTPGSQCYGDVVIGCTFNDIDAVGTNGSNSVLKMYSMVKPLFDDNVITNSSDGVECFAYKADISQFTIRGNSFSNIGYTAISGNMDTHNTGEETYGEVCYNYVADADLSGLDIGNARVGDFIGQVDVYRNTFVCPIRVQNLYTVDGPYTFLHNVIQNADGAQAPWAYIQDTSISDSSRVTLTDNLTGASGVVDGSGNLTGANVSYLGTRGRQIP
jgi:hypothetical protein